MLGRHSWLIHISALAHRDPSAGNTATFTTYTVDLQQRSANSGSAPPKISNSRSARAPAPFGACFFGACLFSHPASAFLVQFGGVAHLQGCFIEARNASRPRVQLPLGFTEQDSTVELHAAAKVNVDAALLSARCKFLKNGVKRVFGTRVSRPSSQLRLVILLIVTYQ